MILLSGHTLGVANRFRAESMQLTLDERSSSCTFTVGPEAPGIGMNNWLKIESGPGSGIVWRVKSVTQDYVTNTRTITMEHVIQILRDYILFGEHTPEMIGGTTHVASGTAARYVLDRQDVWQLGDIEDTEYMGYHFNGDNLFSAMETITKSLDAIQWEYDFSSMPFTLHLRKHPGGFDSEMRMQRNIVNMQRTIDRSRLFTRFYPIGLDDLHLPGAGYMSRNEDIWGVICKVETDQTRNEQIDLEIWANERLEKHSNPLVTITVTGLDLSASTGEPLDHIVLGRQCRVPLPDYGTTLTERVVKLSWADAIAEPEKVTVTLANQIEDVAAVMNRQKEETTETTATARWGSTRSKDDHAWIEDTEDHVSIIAEAIIGTDENGVDWSRVSEIRVDGEGIHNWVKKCQGDLVVQQAEIDINEERINQEVIDRSQEGRELSGRITVSAGKIEQIVTAVGEDGEVTAASICLAINDSGDSEARINAGKIYLLGETIANKITTDYITAKLANAAIVNVNRLNANTLTINPSGGAAVGVQTGFNASSLSLSGNTYKLTLTRFNGQKDEHSFSRAVSSWSVGGGSGKVNVTANPQGQTKGVPVSIGGVSRITSNGTYFYRVYYENDSGDDVETGASKSVTVDIPAETHSIDIPTSAIRTQSSAPSGYTQLTTLRNQYESAKLDGYYLCFRVDCGNSASKWYYMKP